MAPPPPGHQSTLGVVSPGRGSGAAGRNQAPNPQGLTKGQRRQRNRQAKAKAAPPPAPQGKGGKGEGKGKRKGKNISCWYCQGPHMMKDCPKWQADGRPAVQGAKRAKTSDK